MSGSPAANTDDASLPNLGEASEKAKDENPVSSKPTASTKDAGLREMAAGVLAYLNEKAGSAFRDGDKNIGFVIARLKAGATVEDCRRVIDNKVEDWLKDPTMSKYLRPETLFNDTKFSQYVGEVRGVKKQAIDDVYPGKYGSGKAVRSANDAFKELYPE